MIRLSNELKSLVERATAQVLPEVVAFRRERHRRPELTWQELATARAIAERLRTIGGMTVTEGVGRNGIVAVIEGAADGPTVGLRADMDALPVVEVTGKEYASEHAGVMHACGHDGHMANLLGSAMVLVQLRQHLRGRVKLLFQPAEEGGAGADAMCRDGALENPHVDLVFGLHGWPELATGQVYVRGGPMMAANTEIRIVVHGVGCHAATPHLGTDQVLIAARIIEALQSVSARLVAPNEPVAVSITKIAGGSATNIIPPHVEMAGTLRTMTVATRDGCCAAIRRLAEGVAQTHGATATVEFEHGYPSTVNDTRATDFIESLAQQVLPAGHTHRMPAPTMGAEDFAYFLERVPGCYFFLGVDDGRAGGYPSLHHPAYDFNDAALPTGIKLFVHAALAAKDFLATQPL